MCGIVGYIGHRDPLEIVISGLHRLEYRGYDSAGVAYLPDGAQQIEVIRAVGKIKDLERAVQQKAPVPGIHHVGIGHTRWATHGAPTELNAHPHRSNNGKFAIVHNGIIENYSEIKRRLTEKGYVFSSETDSEVVAHLLEELYEGDFRAAVVRMLEHLQGAYGLCIMCSDHPDMLIAARKGSPIVVGVGSGETIIASDVSAIVNYTNRVIYLKDGDIVTATTSEVDITECNSMPVSRETSEIEWDVEQIEKGGFDHFMLKEIHEQPEAIANAIRGRMILEDGMSVLSGMQMDAFDMARVDRMIIAACGTSYYAGMTGQYFFEEFAGLPTGVEQAAEFRYRNPVIQRDSCMLAISQSGETADTLAAVREAKRKGTRVLGICNVVGSTIARETGAGVYLHAGPEISVASTKAFTCQVAVLALLALGFARTRRMSMEEGRHIVEGLQQLPDLVRRVLETAETIREVAERYASYENFFFIGRGYMYPAALEGALKLKEVSYIHAE
ncbi:MAG: glutamine--fructose-6-phosphate transaminase (isomerizing), partial [Kiritimatiellae bacterium]|nr:glutamine--fructose-6-phosphate transaminase (isomerizing) [Kiritimatiellia bacterium]